MVMIYMMWYMFLYISIFLSFGKAHNNGKLNDDEWQNGGTVTKGPIFSILKNEVFDRKIQFRIFIIILKLLYLLYGMYGTLYRYIHVCVCVYVIIYIYIYIYIYISAISKPLLSSIYECLPPLLLSDPLLLLLPSNPKFCKSPYFGFLFVMEYKT